VAGPQLGGGDGDLRFVLADPAGQPPVACPPRGSGCDRRTRKSRRWTRRCAGEHVLGGAALPARHRLGLDQLLFPRREQFLDHDADPVEHYRQQIRYGQLQDGDMLPSGREIAAGFGVSLATAAKVAAGLQAIGLVTPRPGAGTVMTASRPPADRARGGPLLITLATRTPSRPGDKARVVEAAMVAARQDVAAQLGIELPAQVVRRQQVSTRDGVIAAMLTSWFPQPVVKGIPELLSRARLTKRSPATSPPGRQIAPIRSGP